MLDRERVRKAFASPAEFTTSPLYRALSQTVAASDQLLDLAGQGRPGQYPTFLFFGAVHRLLLRGTDHPLGGYYPSVVGAAALPAADAGPALESFGQAYAAELAETIRTRLVQTSVVQRTLGLRIGLSAIAAATREPMTGPLHVIEVGASAGLNLRFEATATASADGSTAIRTARCSSRPRCTARVRCPTWTGCRSSAGCRASI